MPVASARTRQLPPPGTIRLTVAIAHAILSGEGRPPATAPLRTGRLIASAIRRTRANVSVHVAARIANNGASDLRTNPRSDGANAKSLAIRNFRSHIPASTPNFLFAVQYDGIVGQQRRKKPSRRAKRSSEMDQPLIPHPFWVYVAVPSRAVSLSLSLVTVKARSATARGQLGQRAIDCKLRRLV